MMGPLLTEVPFAKGDLSANSEKSHLAYMHIHVGRGRRVNEASGLPPRNDMHEMIQ